MRVQSFMTFRASLGPQKCDSFRRRIIIIIIKAASSDERDLAPGLTANGGFRKTGNGEQYAFKEENIEGISKSFICAKLPAASWWRYEYKWILACRYLQESTLIKHMKFGAD